MMKRLFLLFLSLASICTAQVAVAPTPVPKFRSFVASGAPNSGGCVFSYITLTSTPLATYTDYTGATPNTNPVILDANGEAQIWLQAATYRIQVWTNGGVSGNNCASGSQLYSIDGISEKGLLSTASLSVLLAPPGGVNQTVSGPLTATQFNGPATGLSTPATIFTATNRPTVTTTNPVSPGQNYQIPDPATASSHFVLDTGATNTLDCTAGIVTCKRTATYSFIGAQCNNATAGLGWDTFSTNSPTPVCITGTNIQKGALGLPSAYTHVQKNTGTNSATTTVTTTYPAATVGGNGDMLVLSVAFNGTTTITGCTDTTNAYTQAKHVATGALSLDVWVFHNATTKAAGTTLTCTFAGAATSSLIWHEYIAPSATSTDVSASNTGIGTAVTTGTTASTAQNTELVFAAAGDLAAPTLVPTGSGYTDHLVLNNASTVQVDDAGIIQQAIATQATTFTLGSSQTWAAAIVTFKATNGGSAIAQKTVILPTFFNSAQAINASIKWTVPLAPVAISNAVLGAAIVCTPDAATDDPAFNADTTATTSIPSSAANVTINTPLNALAAGTCAAGNTLHYQIKRLRYNASDTNESFAQVLGANLTIGINQ